MISVAEAESKILEEAEKIRLQSQCGACAPKTGSRRLEEGRSVRVAEGLVADRDFPPFDRVTMDGIALRKADLEDGCRSFVIAGIQPAGVPPLSFESLSLGSGPACSASCFEVMTGAVLPLGTDTVIRYEDVRIEAGCAHVSDAVAAAVRQGESIQKRGAEGRRGDLLVPPGRVWRAPQWALAASVGAVDVRVEDRPELSVLIVATGDELVSPHRQPQAHEIRASNPYALAAALRDFGFGDPHIEIVGDAPEELQGLLQRSLGQVDVCLLTGAVSAGKFDHVPQTLSRLGVAEVFHRVRQRPGKPLWFGVWPGESRPALVFGLPGNPVSALVGCYRYVLPALEKRLGGHPESLWSQAVLAEPLEGLKVPGGMARFVPVVAVDPGSAVRRVRLITSLGSGDLVSLAQSDGFVECPEGVSVFPEGTAVRYFSWGRP